MGLALSWMFACAAIEGQLIGAPQGAVPEVGGTVDDAPPLPPELDAAPLEGTREPGLPGDRLFAEDVLHDFAITVSDSAYRSLRDHPREEVEGTLAWRTQEFRVGVKLKGSSSFRTIREKPSFKIDVHAFESGQRIDGLKRLTLNNMIQDPTMLREHAYYWLAGRLDVAAPRQAYARVTFNGEPYGLYSLIETMDGRLMKRLFPDDPDGNLYDASGADFTYERDWFDVEVDGGIAPIEDDMAELVDAVVEAGDDDFAAMFAERFDQDAVLGYFAIDIVTGNDDGYVFNHHNYLPYHLAHADRWLLLPWGTDRSFTNEVSPYGDWQTPVAGVLAARCWEDDNCADSLHERIEAVLAVWEDGSFTDMLARTAAVVGPECEADVRRDKRCDIEDIEEFVEARAGEVREALE